jgi:hypothetical protein
MNNDDRTKARRAYVLRKLALTRSRQKAWREHPEKMEAIRRQATVEAKAVRERNNEHLRAILRGWPEKMSPGELKQLVEQRMDYAGKYSSLTYRLTRCNLLRFDADGYWHNLCNLPAE